MTTLIIVLIAFILDGALLDFFATKLVVFCLISGAIFVGVVTAFASAINFIT